MRRPLPLLLLSLLLSGYLGAQIPREKELIQALSAARTDAETTVALGNLAELYSLFRLNKKADSLLEKQMVLAEATQNNELIEQTLSSRVIDNLSIWSDKETFDRATAFLQKALLYAKTQANPLLEANIRLKLVRLNRKRQWFEPALEQATLALLLLDKKQDSLKAALFLEVGEAFAGKGDAVSAYRNFNNAFDIAYSLRNSVLQSAAWHSFSSLYKSLGDTALAKNSLSESLKLNEKQNNRAGLLADYIAFSKLTAEKIFIEKALALAANIDATKDILQAKRLMLSYIMVVEKNSEKALAYLRQHPDLNAYTQNNGLPNYNTGAIYHYAGQNAEAVRYYLLDEPLINSSFDPSVQLSYYSEIADCYWQLGQDKEALAYYSKALNLGKQFGSAAGNAATTAKLSKLFARNGNYRNAYDYNQLSLGYNETLKEQAKEREVTLLGLEREKKRREKDQRDAAEREQKRRNLQYTSISFAIAAVFLVLILIGMFPVSRVTVRILNFISFICLFEFIIILIDNWLHHVTHGDLLQIWVAKIGIIGLLSPLHHFLEHWTVKFLSSQKLQNFRERISVRNLLHSKKRAAQPLTENLEKSTLV